MRYLFFNTNRKEGRFKPTWDFVEATQDEFNWERIDTHLEDPYGYSKEIRKLTPYEPLPEGTVGGLGFAYIDLPFDYRFEESHGFGEDIWLYRSLKMKLHYWKLRLGHKKEFVLWND